MRNLRLLFLVGLATGFISEKLFVSSQLFTTDDIYLEGQTSGDLPIDDEDGEDDGSGSGSGDYPFIDLRDDKEIKRVLNFSMTTVTKEMVPSQPQPTADFAHNTLTTAAESKDPPTTVKDMQATTFIYPNGESTNEETTSPSSTSLPPIETTTATFGIDISVTEDTDKDNSVDVSTPKDIEDLIREDDNNILGSDGRGSRMLDIEPPKEVTSENLWERTEVLAAVIACGVVGFLCAVFLLLLLGYRMKKKDEGSYDLGDTKLSNTTYHKAPTKEFYA